MKLFNTASKKLENFVPKDKDNVKVYTCGPTVYSTAHIGNFTAYIYWDLLIRALKMNGYKVNRVMNITDVGHLVSDGDDGEDKMEKGARREGKTVWEVAEFYMNDFLKNFRALNLLEPEKICRATDYIEADKKLVEKMIENGFTYGTSDGVYFDTSKFEDYANFANLDLKGLKAGARVEFNSEKKNPSDFAVWKFIQPGENHAMRWDFLDRPGYPGWHLECSTIIHEELGEPIDIHTGGIDHIPVHHTNEIAQTFAITSDRLANYWLHCNFITINGEKISKSLGNFYDFSDLKEKGFSHIDFKMWILSGNYQTARNFTFEDLTSAKNRRTNWRNKLARFYQADSLPENTDSVLDEYVEKVKDTINNNLNSAAAFSIIDSAPYEISDKFFAFLDELLGLNLVTDSPDISEVQKSLILERESARKAKDFEKADKLREDLATTGIEIKDTPAGPIWQYI